MIASAIIIVAQVCMLIYGQAIGLAVTTPYGSQLQATPRSQCKTGGGPLVYAFTLMVSPSHTRSLTDRPNKSPGRNLVLACVPDATSRQLAEYVQKGLISHALLQGTLLKATAATFPPRGSRAYDGLDMFQRKNTAITNKREMVVVHFGPYGSDQDPNTTYGQIFGGLVPLNVSTGIPNFVTTATPLQTDDVKYPPEPLIAVVMLAWLWRDEAVAESA